MAARFLEEVLELSSIARGRQSFNGGFFIGRITEAESSTISAQGLERIDESAKESARGHFFAKPGPNLVRVDRARGIDSVLWLRPFLRNTGCGLGCDRCWSGLRSRRFRWLRRFPRRRGFDRGRRRSGLFAVA